MKSVIVSILILIIMLIQKIILSSFEQNFFNIRVVNFVFKIELDLNKGGLFVQNSCQWTDSACMKDGTCIFLHPFIFLSILKFLLKLDFNILSNKTNIKITDNSQSK